MELSAEDKILFTNYYNLTSKHKDDIIYRRKTLGMTIDEIARRFQITPPDVSRILSPPKNYGNWTAEEKLRHWIAGKKRSATVKRQRDLKLIK
jgi:predicted transcriptional regulator